MARTGGRRPTVETGRWNRGLGGLALGADPQLSPHHFRFFDNREKYLFFVTTCSEKTAVADRVGMEIANLRPAPPALTLFDAGMGDASVLARVMSHMHREFPTVPFRIIAKEISYENLRLGLEKMPDRFAEHPASVLVLTNMYYREVSQLSPAMPEDRARLEWHEIALTGETAYEFQQQISALEPKLAHCWEVVRSPKTGNPHYARPAVLVLYRADHRFLLDRTIPRKDGEAPLYDLVLASQPYRMRQPAALKVRSVLAPLCRSLAPGGRLIAVQAHGRDPGEEIVRAIWPDEELFTVSRHELSDEIQAQVQETCPDLVYLPYSDRQAVFRYKLLVMPSELEGEMNISTLVAAWNAAVYVAQIEDPKMHAALHDGRYLDATRDVLRKHNGLWFNDEAFVVARRPR